MRTACALELWQEAYRSIEDIHALLQLSKKSPKPHLMATYFEKLAQIFWVSGHHLFHAYALFRFYTFSMAAQASIGNAVAAGTQCRECLPIFFTHRNYIRPQFESGVAF